MFEKVAKHEMYLHERVFNIFNVLIRQWLLRNIFRVINRCESNWGADSRDRVVDQVHETQFLFMKRKEDWEEEDREGERKATRNSQMLFHHFRFRNMRFRSQCFQLFHI